ncbi:MAG TPA: TIGR01777 family oxidoreductase [Fimbriimonas sp.]
MKIVIGGASGFLGTTLVKECADDGHEVVALVRGDKAPAGARAVKWDGKTIGAWASEIDGADVAINLAGTPIALPWTPENKEKIRNSRLDSTKAFRESIEAAARPPRVFLSGSAVGIYGDTADREVDETAPPGSGFMPDLCQEWEQASRTGRTRVVNLRTGIVLGQDSGMLPTLVKLTKAFLGGSVGSGEQYIPWIHLEDWVRLVRWCGLGDAAGPVNLCAPRSVTNSEMMSSLRKVLGRPWAPPAPSLAVKALGALGGPDPSLALASTRVVPRLALAKGFTFKWPELEPALKDLLD